MLPGLQAVAQVLDEVIVTAQKREENLQDVPISISALSAEQLGAAQVNSIADLVSVAPAINLQGASGFIGNLNFSMRGIGAFATDNGIQPAIGIVVDEVPLSRQAEFDASLGDVSSIQMLAGPQGTLFGTSTTAGVLVVQTQQPIDTFEGYVEGSITDDDEYLVRASMGGPIAERVNARVSAYYKDLEDFIENISPVGSDWGGEKSYGVSAKFDITLTDTVNLWVSADYRELESFQFNQAEEQSDPPLDILLSTLGNGDPALGQEVLDDIRLVNTDISGTQELESRGVAAKLTWDISDVLSLKSISGYREYDLELSGLIDLDGTPATFANNPGIPLIAFLRTNLAFNGPEGPQVVNALDYFTEELRLQYRGDAVEATFGGFYISHNELFIAEVPFIIAPALVRSQPRTSDNSLKSWAVFGDATWQLSDIVSVFAGARWTEEKLTTDYERHTYLVPGSQWTEANGYVTVADGVAPVEAVAFRAETKDQEWSGRVGATFKINADNNVYISASRGFTGSSVDSSPRATEATAFVDPSIATSYEIGTKSTLFDSRVRLNVALFSMKVDDLQISGTIPGTLDLVTTNAGSVYSEGLEVNLTALLAGNFRIDAGLAWLNTEMGDLIQECYIDQTAAQGCVDLTGDGVPEQNVKGKPGVAAPDLKYNLRGTYDLPLPSLPFDGVASVSYTWQDGTFTNPTFDPNDDFIDSYGLLDVSLGIASRDGRYNVTLFGKNVLDEHFPSMRQSASAPGVHTTAVYTRGAFAYWGLKARWNF